MVIETGCREQPTNAAAEAGGLNIADGGGAIGARVAPPRVLVSSCVVLRADGSCELNSESPRDIVLYVEGSGGGFGTDSRASQRSDEIQVRSGPGSSIENLTVEQRAAGAVVTITPGRNATEIVLTLTVRGAENPYRLRLRSDSEVEWLKAARHHKNDDQVIENLISHLDREDESVSEETRAIALGLLAELLRYTRRDYMGAYKRIKEAIRRDAAAGLTLHRLVDLVALTDLLSRDLNRPHEAEALLQENKPLFEQVPNLMSVWYVQMALARYRRGDARAALEYVQEGEPLARRYGDVFASSSLGTMTAMTLTMLGRFAEGRELLDQLLTEIPPINSTRCRHGGLWEDRAALQLAAWESNGAGYKPTTDEDPRRSAAHAAKILRVECGLTEMWLAALKDLAHAEVLAGEYSAAEAHLAEVKNQGERASSELTVQLQDLEGQIALGKKDWKKARKIYAEMLKSVTTGKDQPVSDAYDSYWRALIGLARVEERRDRESALAYYRAAERHLEYRSLSSPLGQGKGTYLGQRETGTRRYLELLFRLSADGNRSQERLHEALYVIRTARTRGVRSLALLARLGSLDTKRHEAYQQALIEYESIRAQYDKEASAEILAPADMRKSVHARKNQLLSNLNTLQEQALRVLEEVPAGDPAAKAHAPSIPIALAQARDDYRHLEDREMLLTCHPMVDKWLCLLASGQTIVASEMPSLTRKEAIAPETLSKWILSPFAQHLASGRRLRIVAYGAMRQIDIHLLPYGAGQLSDLIETYYALDLPVARTEAAAGRAGDAPSSVPTSQPASATGPVGDPPSVDLQFDPETNMPGGRRVRGEIVGLLENAGFRVIPPPTPPAGSLANEDQRMRARFSGVDLFAFFGHGEMAANGGWRHRLRTNRGGGLIIPDILSAPKVPRWVVLLGCETGLSAEETGGLEGIGPVQSFLIRNTEWAIGAVRPVGDEMTAQFAREFFRELRVPPSDPSPWRALKRAQAQFAAKSSSFGALIDAKTDIAAFRLFRP